MLIDIAMILLAYLSGSISCAIVVCKAMGLRDPRTSGSGNPGASNVLRLHGKRAALLTLVGDMVKGIIPVLLARAVNADDIIVALAGFAAFTGHLLPVFFRFRGGKGVATLVGVLAATDWMLGLAFTATWLTTALIFRYSSLAALIATIMTPLYTDLILSEPVYLYVNGIMGAILIWRHRSNIKKLIDGKEDKIGQDE